MMFTLIVVSQDRALATDTTAQLARIMRDAATRLEAGDTSGTVRTEDGMPVGAFALDHSAAATAAALRAIHKI